MSRHLHVPGPVTDGTRAPDWDVEAAYDAHGTEIYRFAVSAVDDRGAAEEIVQDTFTRAWRTSSRYDPARASLRTWLFSITRNLVIDHHRGRSRRPVLSVVPDDAAGAATTTDGPPLDERVAVRIQLAEALATLSDEHRQVVAAVHLRGRSYAEVADQTGVPVGTLRSRMHYALRALRDALDEQGWRGHE